MMNQIDNNFAKIYTNQIQDLKNKLAESEKMKEALTLKVKEYDTKIK